MRIIFCQIEPLDFSKHYLNLNGIVSCFMFLDDKNIGFCALIYAHFLHKHFCLSLFNPFFTFLYKSFLFLHLIFRHIYLFFAPPGIYYLLTYSKKCASIWAPLTVGYLKKYISVKVLALYLLVARLLKRCFVVYYGLCYYRNRW